MKEQIWPSWFLLTYVGSVTICLVSDNNWTVEIDLIECDPFKKLITDNNWTVETVLIECDLFKQLILIETNASKIWKKLSSQTKVGLFTFYRKKKFYFYIET